MTSLGTILILLLSLLQSVWGEQEISLLFAGDAMQHGPQINAARRQGGSYDYSSCFALIEDDIKAADYAVVNLECPLGGAPYSGYPAFSAPDEFARQLRDSGFDLFLTANNHCLDRRDAGLRRTIATLDALNIPHTGTFLSKQHRSEASPLIIDVKGLKIAMLSYTYGTNGIPIQGSVVVNYIDRDRISADIDEARSRGAEVVCVNLHWGIEYKLLPVESQRSLAHWLVEEKGVDLIIGGHPHVIEPMEIRRSNRFKKDVLLVYSMGNFISNQNGDDSRGGAMVLVNLTTHAGKLKRISAAYRLFFCQKPLHSAKASAAGSHEADPTNYQLIPAHRSDLIRPDSRQAFDLFMRNARRIFGNYNSSVPEAPKPGTLPSRPYLDGNMPALLLR
ncbi:MAG: CapA family protein [Muribaculaceae bacterium]